MPSWSADPSSNQAPSASMLGTIQRCSTGNHGDFGSDLCDALIFQNPNYAVFREPFSPRPSPACCSRRLQAWPFLPEVPRAGGPKGTMHLHLRG